MLSNMTQFGNLLASAQAALQVHLADAGAPGADDLLLQTFDVGRACGLNDKEIAQALITPVRTVLRLPSARA